MADIPIPISDISDPGQIRVKLLASGKDVHAPMSAVASASIHGAAAKTTPVDADEFPLADSADSYVVKKVTWANIKATIWTSLGSLINGGTGKTTPVDADMFAIADSAASNATKKLTWANLKATLSYQPLAAALTSWAAITRATGFDTFATTPSSANLIALLTDETGTGAAVFANTPTLVTPVIGAATGTSVSLTAGFSTSLNPATGPAMNTAGNATSLAQNAEITLSTHSGLLVVVDHTNGAVGIATCGGGAVTIVSAGPGTQYVNSSTPSTSQTGIYFNGGTTYRIKHGFAANHTYGVMWLSARNAV